jgi:uncharacterized protein YhfF
MPPYGVGMSNKDRSRFVTPLGQPDPEVVGRFWQRCVAALGLDQTKAQPVVECFGDTVELANELIELVVDGPKRATAGALEDYQSADEPLPDVGGYMIATDGFMRPRAVLETTEVRVGPLSSVDDTFAWDEGEGDRSRADWLDDHTWYFRRQYETLGLAFSPDLPVVFERFSVVYVEGLENERPL